MKSGKHREMTEERITEKQEEIREAKKLLRRRMREQMRSLPADYVRTAGADIQEQVLSSAGYREAERIFLFISMPKETPTEGLLRQALLRDLQKLQAAIRLQTLCVFVLQHGQRLVLEFSYSYNGNRHCLWPCNGDVIRPGSG